MNENLPVNRRGFLLGAAASALASILPVPVRADSSARLPASVAEALSKGKKPIEVADWALDISTDNEICDFGDGYVQHIPIRQNVDLKVCLDVDVRVYDQVLREMSQRVGQIGSVAVESDTARYSLPKVLMTHLRGYFEEKCEPGRAIIELEFVGLDGSMTAPVHFGELYLTEETKRLPAKTCVTLG